MLIVNKTLCVVHIQNEKQDEIVILLYKDIPIGQSVLLAVCSSLKEAKIICAHFRATKEIK